ncbi:MAG TPA: DoxX family protein [Bradyrhizobium sp.]|nr:DoxX family protein [Bradyrhizobium sp.]
MLFDRGIKLVPLSVVAEAMDLVGHAASETLARAPGAVTVLWTLLYAVPPTSLVGAILAAVYLGGTIASHVRIGSPHVLLGVYLGLIVWGGLWLRDARLRQLLPFNTSTK